MNIKKALLSLLALTVACFLLAFAAVALVPLSWWFDCSAPRVHLSCEEVSGTLARGEMKGARWLPLSEAPLHIKRLESVRWKISLLSSFPKYRLDLNIDSGTQQARLEILRPLWGDDSPPNQVKGQIEGDAGDWSRILSWLLRSRSAQLANSWDARGRVSIDIDGLTWPYSSWWNRFNGEGQQRTSYLFGGRIHWSSAAVTSPFTADLGEFEIAVKPLGEDGFRHRIQLANSGGDARIDGIVDIDITLGGLEQPELGMVHANIDIKPRDKIDSDTAALFKKWSRRQAEGSYKLQYNGSLGELTQGQTAKPP